jgi:tetratricopeptide (TPR) repeat protein
MGVVAMNRKERRAAASQVKRGAAHSISLMTPNSVRDIDTLMNSAVRCHQAGQIAEAEHLYQKILAIDPKHIDSLHSLGLIAHQLGSYEMGKRLR